jgi:DNA-binding NarL/FixJ family response regulator
MKNMFFKLIHGIYFYCGNRKPTVNEYLEVTNIPDDVPVEKVSVLLFNTPIFDAQEVEYSQLGKNTILKKNTLTPTEEKIVELVKGEGLTNRQLGERLGIAEGTIRTHMSKILIKLNIKSREELKEL